MRWGEGYTEAKSEADYYTDAASKGRYGNERERALALIEAILAVAGRLEVLAYKMEVRG